MTVLSLLHHVQSRRPSVETIATYETPYRTNSFDTAFAEFKGVVKFVSITDAHVSLSEDLVTQAYCEGLKIFKVSDRIDNHISQCVSYFSSILNGVRLTRNFFNSAYQTTKLLEARKSVGSRRGKFSRALNQIHQALKEPSDGSAIAMMFYRLIKSIPLMDNSRIAFKPVQFVENLVPSMSSVSSVSSVSSAKPTKEKLNWDGTIIPEGGLCVKIGKYHFSGSPHEICGIITHALGGMTPADLISEPYHSSYSHIFGSVLFRDTRYSVKIHLSHYVTSGIVSGRLQHNTAVASIESTAGSLLVLLAGRPDVTSAMVSRKNILSSRQLMSSELKDFGMIVHVHKMIQRSIYSCINSVHRLNVLGQVTHCRNLSAVHIECFRPTCMHKGLARLTERSNVFRCDACNIAEYCKLCLNSSHSGPCNSSADEQFAASMSDLNLKPCPSCQFVTEKSSGCNHMTCRTRDVPNRGCGAQWCWTCGYVFQMDPAPNTRSSNVTIDMDRHFHTGSCRQFN